MDLDIKVESIENEKPISPTSNKNDENGEANTCDPLELVALDNNKYLDLTIEKESPEKQHQITHQSGSTPNGFGTIYNTTNSNIKSACISPQTTVVRNECERMNMAFGKRELFTSDISDSTSDMNIKRNRPDNQLLASAQVAHFCEKCIDLQTPCSPLVSQNLREFLNDYTFASLSPYNQLKLIELLPNVDQPLIDPESSIIRLNSSCLNNVFFTRACSEWCERLADGEFKPRNQLRLKQFEETLSDKNRKKRYTSSHFQNTSNTGGRISPSPCEPLQTRTIGVVTRAVTRSLRETKSSIPEHVISPNGMCIENKLDDSIEQVEFH